jgi:hypothetical protein
MNSGMRWLAGITGLVSMGSAYMLGAGGNPFKAEWSSFPWYENAILIVWLALPNFMGVGAIVAGTRQRLGLRLTQIGAVFSSVFLVPLAAVGAFSPGGPWDIGVVALRCLFAITAILVVLIDVALIRTARAQKSAPFIRS